MPTNKYSLKCPYPMVPEFYVIHNTANDANAMGEINYMIGNNSQTSYHYAIDDKNIIQAVPEHRNTWHAGDGGQGAGNRKGIGIEICFSKSGGPRFNEAEKLEAKFVASRLKARNWDMDKIKKHQDFSGKYCPHRTLDLGWGRFLTMVQTELNQLNAPTVNKPTPPTTENPNPSSWAIESWNWAQATKLSDGTRPRSELTREEFVTMLKRLHDSK